MTLNLDSKINEPVVSALKKSPDGSGREIAKMAGVEYTPSLVAKISDIRKQKRDGKKPQRLRKKRARPQKRNSNEVASIPKSIYPDMLEARKFVSQFGGNFDEATAAVTTLQGLQIDSGIASGE